MEDNGLRDADTVERRVRKLDDAERLDRQSARDFSSARLDGKSDAESFAYAARKSARPMSIRAATLSVYRGFASFDRANGANVSADEMSRTAHAIADGSARIVYRTDSARCLRRGQRSEAKPTSARASLSGRGGEEIDNPSKGGLRFPGSWPIVREQVITEVPTNTEDGGAERETPSPRPLDTKGMDTK